MLIRGECTGAKSETHDPKLEEPQRLSAVVDAPTVIAVAAPEHRRAKCAIHHRLDGRMACTHAPMRPCTHDRCMYTLLGENEHASLRSLPAATTTETPAADSLR